MKQQGFILPAVFIFLQIFFILSLIALLPIISRYKVLAHQEQHQELLRTVDSFTENFAKQTIPENCLVPTKTTDELLKLPLSWWQTHACHVTFQASLIYYVVEHLGLDDCGQISEGQIANYYRIDVRIVNALFQSTFVNAYETENGCQQKRHSVLLGRQMWREI